MSTSKVIAESILRLTTTEFFEDVTDYSEREFELLDLPFEGVAINAPRTIDLTMQDVLPVVIAIADTTRRQWEVYREKNLALLAISIDSDAVFIAPAFPPPDKEPMHEPFSRLPPEPEEAPPYTSSAKIEMLQARDRLNLPWKPGRYSLAVINYDWVSNIVQVELMGRGNLEEGQLPAIAPEPVSQVGVFIGGVKIPLPSYDVHPATPPLPLDGLEFLVAASTSDSMPVFGAFAVKAKTRYIDQGGTVHIDAAGKRSRVVGVIPLTLLVFGLDGEVPKRFDWAVPAYGSVPVAVGSWLKGAFAIDALQGTDDHLSSGRYMAYIVCDAKIYGPHEFTL